MGSVVLINVQGSAAQPIVISSYDSGSSSAEKRALLELADYVIMRNA